MAATTEIEAALERLTRGYGLYRKDLIEALQGDLSVLQRFWEIDLDHGRGIARDRIVAKLYEHLAKIEPSESRKGLSADQRGRQYRFNVLVCFNAADESRLPKLKDMLLGERREWLEKEARPPYKIKARTGRRNLDHAIEQIAKQIIDADALATPETEADSNASTADRTEEEVAENAVPEADDTEPADDPKKQWPRPRWIAVTAVGAIVVLAGAYEVANYASSAANVPSPRASSSANSGSSMSGAPPIALTAQLTTTYLDGDGVWVFPPTIGTNPLKVIAGIAPQITSSAPGIGGKLVSPGIFRITLDNTSAYMATINSMRPVITGRNPLATGILVTLGGQGTETVGDLGFDLDSTAPYAEQVDSSGKLTGTSFFRHQNIRMAAGDQDTIDLTTIAVQADYTFKLEVSVSVNGRLWTFDLNGPNGKPFEVTGRAAHYESRIENGVNPLNPAEVQYATP